MKALVFAESAAAATELCAGVRTLAEEVVCVTLGETVTGVADKTVVINVPDGHPKEDAHETALAVMEAEDPQIVLSEPTRRLKIIVGKLAAHEGASVQTDVTAFCDGATESMYFGGVGIRKEKSASPIVFCTAGAGVFGDVQAQGTDVVETPAFVEPAAPLACTLREQLPPADVDLTAAKNVVAAGRGFAQESELDLAREFCKKIGAELGCTRPLTEGENWFPREAYIGVSGLMLTPEVYVGIGTSGQMQHMVGVDRAKVAFAINKDKNAPIFQKVDYGLVGEITTVLPEVNARL
ncbi:MAG TPA: electron transfer flavoprotein subunit alpha/FixB family protein [Candidatus Aveggerthella excrementigallinarum]|nr:electron transfer flavoprotein subunit alpha/FixB family protein [Candidatus Aveggerthella excrementigallinarum]